MKTTPKAKTLNELVNEKNVVDSYEINEMKGTIILHIGDIQIEAVPFRGRNGIYFSLRSQKIIDTIKFIIFQEGLSTKKMLELYEAFMSKKDNNELEFGNGVTPVANDDKEQSRSE